MYVLYQRYHNLEEYHGTQYGVDMDQKISVSYGGNLPNNQYHGGSKDIQGVQVHGTKSENVFL